MDVRMVVVVPGMVVVTVAVMAMHVPPLFLSPIKIYFFKHHSVFICTIIYQIEVIVNYLCGGIGWD
jgi:hypothetical protein